MVHRRPSPHRLHALTALSCAAGWAVLACSDPAPSPDDAGRDPPASISERDASPDDAGRDPLAWISERDASPSRDTPARIADAEVPFVSVAPADAGSSCVLDGGPVWQNGEAFLEDGSCNVCICDHGSAACALTLCQRQHCGLPSLPSCPSGHYCVLPACYLSERSPGVCQKLPSDCSGGPVCGCDGRRYEDQCAAAAVNMRVESLGACP